jgi:hypothetical protein
MIYAPDSFSFERARLGNFKLLCTDYEVVTIYLLTSVSSGGCITLINNGNREANF